VAECIDCHIQY